MSKLHEDLGELATLCEEAGPVKVTMPDVLFSELGFLEVETGGDGSPAAKAFIAAMNSAKRAGKGRVLMVGPEAMAYMLGPNGPLRQHTDIWRDSDEPEAKKALRAATSLYKKLSAAHR